MSMDNVSPFVTIVVPTYNRKHLIGDTLNSVFAQRDDDFELVVVDDGSTDGTSEWITRTYGDRLKLVTVENGERGRARNIGARQASGRYVYFLDSDDLLYPEHIAEAKRFSQAHQEPPWFFQTYEILPDRNSVAGSGKKPFYDKKNPVKTLVCEGNFMSCHGVFVRRDVALAHPFHEDRRIAGSEDYALWLELAARYPLVINDVTTSALVEHGGRSVFNFPPDILVKRMKSLLYHALEDDEIRLKFAPLLNRLKANRCSYVALHAAMGHHRKTAVRYFFKSIRYYPPNVFARRTLAIIKHLM